MNHFNDQQREAFGYRPHGRNRDDFTTQLQTGYGQYENAPALYVQQSPHMANFSLNPTYAPQAEVYYHDSMPQAHQGMY
jgi:hypothetical protein